MQLKGQLAVITGASSGIGEACARYFASQGARVVLLARNRDRLQQIIGEIRKAGGIAAFYAADLSNSSAVAEVCRQIRSEHGDPTLLINNAGAGRFLTLSESTAEDAVTAMGTPFFSSFFITREFLPAMLRDSRGSIININSPAAFQPFRGSIGYACSRWALRGFSEALSLDLKGTSVHVGHLVPAKVSSAYFENNPGSEDRVPALAKFIGTLTPEQVARAAEKMIRSRVREQFIPRRLSWVAALQRLFPSISRKLV